MATNPLRPEIQKIEQEYKRNVAVLEARPRLERGLLFLWLLIDIGLIAYFIVTVVLYTISGSFAETRQISTIGQNAGSTRAASVARAAEPLLLGDAKVLQHATGSYDLYATAKNVNTEWYATVKYSFLENSITVKTQEATIMPGETQYLLALAVESPSRPAGAQLEVSEVVWTRVDRHAIADTKEYLESRSSFAIDNRIYSADVALEKGVVGRSTFTLANPTAYSYFDPTFIVLLKRAGTIVAINTIDAPKLLAGETREMEVHWFRTVPTSGTVEVIADIDYFSADTYMAPVGDAAKDIRDQPLRR